MPTFKTAFNNQQSNYFRADFIVADCASLPFKDEVFDFTVAFDVLEHVKRPICCLEEVHRVLKSSSKFFLETPNKLSFFSFQSHSSLINQLRKWWYDKTGKEITYAECQFSSFEKLFTLSQLMRHLTRVGFQETHLLMPQKTEGVTRRFIVQLFEKISILKWFKPSLNIVASKIADD